MVNDIKGGFPDFSNINPENLERKFNYEVWNNPDLKFEAKFLRVSWDSDYSDLVDWTDEEMRDEYFDRDFGENQLVIEEDASGPQWNHRNLMKWIEGDGKYGGSLRVKIPSETITMYNYLAVTYKYPQPVPGPNNREIKYFFFVRAVNNLAPNTSEVFLSLDVWTTYKEKAIIQGVTLLQGHKPLADVSATEYLLNPVASGVDLTADEPDLPRVKNQTKSVDLVSFTKSNPRVCIATTANWADEAAYWSPHKSGIPPDNWWTGEDLGWGGASPVAYVGNSYINGSGPGIHVYSIEPENYSDFIQELRMKLPQAIKTIKAVYVFPAELIGESGSTSILGFTLKQVTRQTTPHKIKEIGIDKALFDFNIENEEFSKLYTDQFSEISISDNKGNSTVVNLYSLAGNLDVYARANTAFPFLKLEAFIDGIGGRGAKNYTVAPWGSQTATVFNSQFQNFTFELDVPIYGVYIDPRQDSGVENSIKNYIMAQERETTFDNSTRNINKEYNIAARTRVAEFNTTALSIDASNDNTILSVNNTHTNSFDSIDREYDNSVTVRQLSYNNDSQNIDTTSNITRTNQWGGAILQSYNAYAASVNNFLGISSQALTIASTAVSSSISSISMGASGGGPGAIIGAVGGVVNMGVSVVAGINQLQITQEMAEQKFYDTELSFYTSTSPITPSSFSYFYSESGVVKARWPLSPDTLLDPNPLVTRVGNEVIIESVTSRVSNLRRVSDLDIRDRNRSAQISINSLNKSTDEDIADRSRTVGLAVNTRTTSTDNSNNNTIHGAGGLNQDNYTEIRDVARENRDASRALMIEKWNAEEALSYTGVPMPYGEFSGPGEVDNWGMRGITVTVNTVNKASERIIGDYFRLKGYTANSLLVRKPILSLMENWTYWRAEKVWINAVEISDTNEEILKNIFLRGCTIWRNPDSVKNISLPNGVS